MHFCEPLRKGNAQRGVPESTHYPNLRAHECPDPYIFQVRRMPGSIHFYQSLRTTVRRKASAACGRTCRVDFAL